MEMAETALTLPTALSVVPTAAVGRDKARQKDVKIRTKFKQ